MTDKKLTITKTNIEKNQVELDISAPQDIANKAYSVACRSAANEVNIPGFRKGKAPKNVVEQTVGAGYIAQKAFEKIFYSVLIEASVQENLDIIDVLQVKSYELIPNKPFSMKVLVELKPEVKLGNYKKKKIKAKKIVYDKDAFIKNTLDKLASNFITFKTVEDREVKKGDAVTLDFDGKFEDGTEVPGGKAENYQAILEDGAFLPEFVEKLQGVKIGVRTDIEITFPETSGKEFASRKAIFNVVVNKIEEKVFPELNDDFAKQIGVSTMDELNQKIIEEMESIQTNNSKNDFEVKLVESIIADSEFEIPENMLQKEIDFLLRDLKASVEKSGKSWSDFKADEKNKDIFKNSEESARKRLSADFVIGAIIKSENIGISEAEVNAEVLTRINKLGDKYKNLESDFRFKSSVEQSLLRNKAVDFLCENNEPDWEEEKQKVGAN